MSVSTWDLKDFGLKARSGIRTWLPYVCYQPIRSHLCQLKRLLSWFCYSIVPQKPLVASANGTFEFTRERRCGYRCHLTKCVYHLVLESPLPHKSSTYCLLWLIKMLSRRSCGGVDFLKPVNKYIVSDKLCPTGLRKPGWICWQYHSKIARHVYLMAFVADEFR